MGNLKELEEAARKRDEALAKLLFEIRFIYVPPFIKKDKVCQN